MGKMKLTTFNELKDKYIGLPGTHGRDQFEDELRQEVEAYHMGELIRNARQQQHITQEQLGKLMGVQKAQVSRIERGRNLTLNTVRRAFRAMGVTLRMEAAGCSVVIA